MKKPILFLILLSSVLLFSNCSKTEKDNEVTSPLQEVYEGAFKIGSAVNQDILNGRDPVSKEIVLEEFNTLTLENAMKAALINPEPDVYKFQPADNYVDFGEENNMFIIGHTLVWHNQTPT